jgi:tRNA threonylcarbamoyladenosine biosynthesis protein TsaB
MLVLALDTCDSRGSIALLRDGDLLQAARHDTAEDYSSWLLPAVDRVLKAQQLSHRDLSVYAVAGGPGSFTGVRVGLTTVKAWSEAYGQPIAAVSRLEALASYAASQAPLVAAFTDAQRKQVFGALYRRQEDALHRVADELVIPPAQFLDWVIQTSGSDRIEWISPDPQCVASTEQWASRLALGETIRVVAPVLAPAVGRLGYQLAQHGRLTDALSLDANYVRRSDAELLWKGASGAPR